MTLLAPRKWETRAAKAKATSGGRRRAKEGTGCRVPKTKRWNVGSVPPPDPCSAESVCRVAHWPRGRVLVPPCVSVGHFPGANDLRFCICVTIRARALLASSIVRSFHDQGGRGHTWFPPRSSECSNEMVDWASRSFPRDHQTLATGSQLDRAVSG